MKNLDNREWLTLATVYVIFIACLYIWVAEPYLINEYEQINIKNRILNERIARIDNFNKEALTSKEFTENMEQRAKRLQFAIPKDMEQGSLVFDLQQLATDCRVELKEITPKPVTNEDNDKSLSYLPIKIVFRADYLSLLNFLQSLQNNKRYILLNYININNVYDNKSLITYLDVELTATIFALTE